MMIKKICYVFIIILLIMASFSGSITVKASSINSIISGADNFLNEGKDNSENAIDMQMVSDTSNLIYNSLLILGTCIAVIVGTVLGIQFIIGSVEAKSKVKESLIPYLIGCVVLFSAFGIWKLVIILIR